MRFPKLSLRECCTIVARAPVPRGGENEAQEVFEECRDDVTGRWERREIEEKEYLDCMEILDVARDRLRSTLARSPAVL